MFQSEGRFCIIFYWFNYTHQHTHIYIYIHHSLVFSLRGRVREANRMHVGVHGNCPLGFFNSKHIRNESRNFSKIWNIQFHENGSEFLELLHDDGRAEINKGTKRHVFVAIFPELTQAMWMYTAADCCSQRNSACYVPRLIAQHIYCTHTLQTVHSATELYLQ